MIYFFEKEQDYLRCEILPEGPRGPYVINVIEPGGLEHSERYRSSTDTDARWNELRARFLSQGWTGPMGRDARS